MLQGQRDLTQRRPDGAVRAVPGGAARSRPSSTCCDSRGRRAAAHAAGRLRLGRAQEALGKQVGLGQGLVGQCALEKQKIAAGQPAAGLHPHLVRPGRGRAAQRPGAAAHLRGAGPRACWSWPPSAGSTRATRRSSTSSPSRSASCSTRSRRTCGRRACSSSPSRWPSSCRPGSEELQQTNEELQEKARLLAQQNQEVERKNNEVEQARQALEEKASSSP